MEILIILFLILLNGIFSMSEIALVSSRKFKLETAARKGNANARKALELANNPNTFLSTVQIGITLIGILTGIFSGDTIATKLQGVIEKVDLLKPYAHTLSVVTILIIVTFFSIVLGELLPKRIGLMFPEAIAAAVARPMTFISIITKPFIWLLTKTNDLVLFIFGLKEQKEGIVSEAEIKAIVQESAKGGEIQQIEQNIVHRVFALGDRKVSELMTHRSDLLCFNINDNLATVKEWAQQELHSVYPVFETSRDNLIGIVSVKDIFPKDFSQRAFSLSDFLKQPLSVTEHTPAYKVLELFRKNKIHYGFVVDEYGEVQGMVSMDDILDALIGDVSEYNQQDYEIVQRDEKSWLADGQYPFFEFLHYFHLTEDDQDTDYNTLAGLLLSKLGHIPVTGETVSWKKFEFEVIDMDNQRIDKILITRKA
ncbi:hemolysin family protein [Paraflavitalea pollutisoli]|uniref:hemolysin family protein n=1 Tax=Paraflavitalea pollutisoli TaxID=3034143 RepID=UPI0023EDB3CC|nr:hemolysin family protein [Paraflavitalea sp. H1-2-19X]